MTTPPKPRTTTTDYSTGRKHFASMTRSWTSSGSTRSHGPKSRTFEAPLSSNGHRDSGLPCSRRSTPSYEPLCTTDLPPPTLNQHGRSFSSAVGSSWEGRRRTRRMPLAPASWRRVWNSSGLCSTVRAECDAAPTAQGRTKSRAERTEARIRKVATLARTGERGRALAAARNAPPSRGT